MTKDQILNEVVNTTGVPRRQALKVMEAFMKEVITANAHGRFVSLRGFGTFTAKKRKARPSNLRGQRKMIPTHFTPVFKPSNQFKRKIKAAFAKSMEVLV